MSHTLRGILRWSMIRYCSKGEYHPAFALSKMESGNSSVVMCYFLVMTIWKCLKNARDQLLCWNIMNINTSAEAKAVLRFRTCDVINKYCCGKFHFPLLGSAGMGDNVYILVHHRGCLSKFPVVYDGVSEEKSNDLQRDLPRSAWI